MIMHEWCRHLFVDGSSETVVVLIKIKIYFINPRRDIELRSVV